MPSPLSASLSPLRQAAAEVLANAVSQLFPGVQLVDGGATPLGFFYDFIFLQAPPTEMLPLIEEKMRGLIKADEPMEVWEMMRENAADLFSHFGQKYKARLVAQAPTQLVKVCAWGAFRDYMTTALATPDAPAGSVAAFKLKEIFSATAPDNAGGELPVTRIVGTAFAEKSALKDSIRQEKTALQTDHRALGRALGIFSQQGAAADAPWDWTLQGSLLRSALQQFWLQQHISDGCYPVACRANSVDEALLYQQALYNRELQQPQRHKKKTIRLASWVDCSDGCPSSALWGMSRTRKYTADIVQIFSPESNLLAELISSLQFIQKTANMFDLEGCWILTFSGQQKSSEHLAIAEAAEAAGIAFETHRDEACRDGGRKVAAIRLQIPDVWGRLWPCSSVSLPIAPRQRGYRSPGGGGAAAAAAALSSIQGRSVIGMEKTVVVRRALFGSLERWTALLTERCQGSFPCELRSLHCNRGVE